MPAFSRPVCKLFAPAAILLAVCPTVAQAVDNTRYVSINGNNSNDCTLAAPCRTLQRGIDETPVGGELRILDSGVSANNVIINKSITISGDGHTLFPGSSEITIDAAGAVVTLRRLTLDGRGMPFEGIDIIAADAVYIEQCTIHGYSRNGIRAIADEGRLFVRDSIVRDNRLTGIAADGTSLLMIDRSRFANNGRDGTDDSGIAVGSGHATISHSVVSGNPTGIYVYRTASVSIVSTAVVQNDTNGAVATGIFPSSNCALTMDSSLIHGNGVNGLLAVSGCSVRISNSTVAGNGRGIQNTGAVVETRQNNTVRGNGTDLSGNALTAIGGD